MKRLVALLLGLMLLFPGLTHAEGAGYEINVTFSTDEESVSSALRSLLDTQTSNMASICQAIAELVNSLAVKMDWLMTDELTQTRLSFDMMGANIIDLAGQTHNQTGLMQIVSEALLPGHVLVASIPEDELASMLSVQAMYDKTDWQSVLEALKGRVDAWCAATPSRVENGLFVGDLFDSGVRREIYLADDRDLVLLADMLLDALETQNLPLKDLGRVYLKGQNPLTMARTSLHKVANENRYAYQLCRVYDDQENEICVALTVLDQGEQVSTVSFAPVDQGIRMLWGFGMQGGNRYLELTCTQSTDGQKESLNTNIKLYLDADRAGYRAASQSRAEFQAKGTLEVTRGSDGSAKWETTWAAGSWEKAFIDRRVNTTGSWRADTQEISVDVMLHASAGSNPDLTVSLRGGKVEATPMDFSELKEIDMLSESAETEAEMLQLIEDSANALGMKLFKLIPAPLMTLLMMN